MHLIRHVAPNSQQRVLMTNLFDEKRFPASCFGELYHQRWSIEEAFKRFKHCLNLEHVTGLSQQAVVQDAAAKIVCDNLQVLTALTAHTDADLPASKRINHAYAQAELSSHCCCPSFCSAQRLAERSTGYCAICWPSRRTDLSSSRKHLETTQARPKTAQIHHSEKLLKGLNLGGLGFKSQLYIAK